MKRFGLLLLIFSTAQAQVFERDFDADSVVLAPICIPDLAGQGWATVDFDTTSLNVTIIASGDGAYQAFDYSGGNIDDGPTDFTWGDPTTDAVEIDAISTGASSGCISLSIRDEVLAVASATEWSITFTDGLSALMDHEAFIRIKDATSAQATTAQSDLDTLTGTDGATLATAQGNYAPAKAGDQMDLVNDAIDDGSIDATQTELASASALTTLTNAIIIGSGTCDSGEVDSCTDAARTEADDIWKGAGIVFPTIGETSCVYDFANTGGVLSFWTLETNLDTEAYVLVRDALCETAVDDTP